MRTLAGLLDFECAARWGSFKLAAMELHKTPAAVSQQIKQLEAALGFELFVRHPRRVSITENGSDLAATISRALGEIEAKIGVIKDPGSDPVLKVSATHSFAMKWLLPRLQGFALQYPEIDLRLESSDQPAVLDNGTCDVAIRYALAGVDDDVVYQERLIVVYSPTLVDMAGVSEPRLETLSEYPLIYEGTPENWLRLFRRAGTSVERRKFARGYSHAGPLVQAAVAGHGIALVPLAIAFEDLSAGRLCLVHCEPLPSPYGYRILATPEKWVSTKVRNFNTWMSREIASMEETFARLRRR